MNKTFFNPELNTYDTYTEVWIPEKVCVKDEKDLLVLNHYWRDSKGELWVDFKNPMENVYRNFDAYRKRKGYMFPQEIKELRKSLNLSVRKFADALGISPSALTQIENNHRIQAKYQENLFRSVKNNPSLFLKQLKDKEDNVNTELNKNSLYRINFYYKNLNRDTNVIFNDIEKLGDAA